MKTQHTPGPWREVGNFVVASSGSGAICRMAVVGPIKYASEPAGYENAANARLIAAAPELLSALEETRDFLMGGDSLESADPWVRELISDTIDPAIARARGES